MIPAVLCADRKDDDPFWAPGALDVEPRGLGSGSLVCSTAVATVPALLVVVVEVGIGEIDCCPGRSRLAAISVGAGVADRFAPSSTRLRLGRSSSFCLRSASNSRSIASEAENDCDITCVIGVMFDCGGSGGNCGMSEDIETFPMYASLFTRSVHRLFPAHQ